VLAAGVRFEPHEEQARGGFKTLGSLAVKSTAWAAAICFVGAGAFAAAEAGFVGLVSDRGGGIDRATGQDGAGLSATQVSASRSPG
jgi:hypothetical protein